MTVTFRDAIGVYPGKGSKLTKGEVDANFYDILLRVIALETGGAFGLDSVEYNGSSITFHWSDSTSSGPIFLPVATFRVRGPWIYDQTLLYLDIVSVTGVGTFLVLVDHVTPSSGDFDPGAENDSGDALYLMIGSMPDLSGYISYRGLWAPSTTYFLNDVVTTVSHGLVYVAVGHVSESTFNLYAINDDLESLYGQFAPPPFSQIKTVTGTSYAAIRNDAGKYIRCTSDVGCQVVLDVGIGLGAGLEWHIRQAGDGPISFVGGTESVVINPPRDGYASTTSWKGATVTIKDVGVNTFDLIGPFGAEAS